MKNKETITLLKNFMEKNSLKKIEVEHSLKLPKNSLSNFLSGKKELPDKWVAPINNFCKEMLCNEVLSSEAHLGNAKPDTVIFTAPEWMKRVEDYCSNAGILPDDLIEFHKEFSSLKLKVRKPKPNAFDGGETDSFKMDEAEISPANSKEVKQKKTKDEKETSSGSNWHYSYRKAKLGF